MMETAPQKRSKVNGLENELMCRQKLGGKKATQTDGDNDSNLQVATEKEVEKKESGK